MGSFLLNPRICILLIACIAYNAGQVGGARILCASHQFGSHMLMVHAVAEGMIKNGHEVYTIFSDIMNVPKGLTEKGFKILKYHTPENGRIISDSRQEDYTMEMIMSGGEQDLADMSQVALGECYDIDKDKKLEKQLKDLKFDIAVVDTFGICTCLMFLPMKLNIPFILVPPALDSETTRSPVLPSFTPVALLLYSDDMTFQQRLFNTMLTAILLTPTFRLFPAVTDTTLLTKYNKYPEVTTWAGLARKADLHFISRGPMLEYPVPLMPNVINIECLTCKPGKSLPSDIQEIADNSQGIIVVSFGSLITKFPNATAEKFLKAFSQRKELIFWRYKGDLPGKVPSNVNIMKWLPQNDLLAHPKTKLFITHSGNNGQYESVYHGVPLLAFPLFAEQPHNAHRICVHSYGLESNIIHFTPEELLEKMNRITEEPNFRQKTQKASKILKTKPMSAQETATYWIEHVLEFGSDHLKSHALDMPWYSYYMLDVVLTFQAVIIVLAICLTLVLKYSYQTIRSRFSGKEKDN